MKTITPDKTVLEYLSLRDKKLGEFIKKRGEISLPVFETPFEALVCSVIDQQVGMAAANAIKKRVTAIFGAITAENLKTATQEQLRACGLSARKSEYILGIISLAAQGKLGYNELDALSDEEIVRTLCEIRGVGPWTAQMLLIFCFCRQDVTSYGDFGIRHGVINLYCLREITEEKFNRLAKRWSPYKTAASLYLWQAAADVELERARKEKFLSVTTKYVSKITR